MPGPIPFLNFQNFGAFFEGTKKSFFGALEEKKLKKKGFVRA